MALTSHAFTVDQIRAAEAPLLQAQGFDDELMRSAASGVARVADALLDEVPLPRILVLAGSGGNGGDALYAAAELLDEYRFSDHPYRAAALLTGRDGAAHQPALEAFISAGGVIVDDLSCDVDLVIDGILGIGASGGLSAEVMELIEPVLFSPAPILSVDVPSGIGADDGETPQPHPQGLPAHISADYTVTFGGLRRAHGLSPHCGEVLLVDARTHSAELSTTLLRGALQPLVNISRALRPSRAWPRGITPLHPEPVVGLEPGPTDDKYTGGVVGIAAGSGKYPGAAILTTTGAVRATSAMVRYAGPQALEVVRTLPEVVATDSVADAGRVQAWVYGPGSGTDDPAPLASLIDADTPLIIDADGLNLLAADPSLLDALRRRTAATVLTPHAGEFARLADTAGLDVDGLSRIDAVCAMAQNLRCAVLLKGRSTLIARPGLHDAAVQIVDCANSWAATPGSGDVLAGICGALMAHAETTWHRDIEPHLDLSAEGADGAGEQFFHPSYAAMPTAVTIHAVAAEISAQTPDGPAPTTASRIAAAVPQAVARLRPRRRDLRGPR